MNTQIRLCIFLITFATKKYDYRLRKSIDHRAEPRWANRSAHPERMWADIQWEDLRSKKWASATWQDDGLTPFRRHRDNNGTYPAGRSVKELLSIIERIHEAGASTKSLRETWLDTTTPQGNLLLTIFAGLSQFERDLTRQRTRQGLEAARARGRKGGRPKSDESKVSTALKMYDSKLHSIDEITKATGISRATLYRAIDKRKKTTWFSLLSGIGSNHGSTPVLDWCVLGYAPTVYTASRL